MFKRIVWLSLNGFIACGWMMVAHGWDARGHELIGAIAYTQLTPTTQQQVDALIHAPDAVYPVRDFIAATTFADELKQQGVTIYNHWHYISQPYATDGRRGRLPHSHHIVWAMERCQTLVSNTHLPAFTRGFFLRMLIHLVGDIHQPLHTIQVFSRAYPEGDLGGNRQRIDHPLAINLHQLWDRAGGLYPQQSLRHRQSLMVFAKQLQIDYPRQSIPHAVRPAHWARQSYFIAIKYGYPSDALQTTPDARYLQQVQQIAGRQLVLAGDRLADMLNQLFDAP
ncbi:MAG: hypothetical protein GKR77_04740 [Legionellales bacterium]|nr:hypothetical protein [Legionellales bacterium]